MWSFFSRDPVKDFNYDLGEPVANFEGKSLWTLHPGKKKTSGDPVSVFAFDVKNATSTQLQTAQSAFKRMRTLRHPNILPYIDGLETERVIYIVTEPVIPLSTYLTDYEGEGSKNELAISWGIHQVAKGLSFLINDGSLLHDNVCIWSVFVDQAGEWKLGGVDYLHHSQDPAPTKSLPSLKVYDPPEKSTGASGNKWSADVWGLGCLIWEVFNGPLVQASSLKSLGEIPKLLVPRYCELVSANPKSRPNPAKFLQSCLETGGYMDNTFVKTVLFLEEIQIQDQAAKNKFFNCLTPAIDSFPEQFCRHKILPQLLDAFQYGNAGSAVLAPLFKVGRLLDSEEYQKKIVPCVVKLFSSPDRATRVKLLQQIEFFVEHLQTSTVNEQIFPHVIQGFMDTNPIVRESTIKAMLHLAAKLNYKNLNEELMKHFARLQSKDDQGGIRTNTTVCLGKIAGHLNPQVRQKIICSAFLRALKDPFPPARQAGILAMAATQNYYSLSEVATRLLPALSVMTMDPDKGVREQCFKSIRGFLTKLEKVSENPELLSEYEKDVYAGGSTAGETASWAGWAVTGVTSLTAKFYKSGGVAGASMQGISTSSNVTEMRKSPPSTKSAANGQPPMTYVPCENIPEKHDASIAEEPNQENNSGLDAWEVENWGDMEDLALDDLSLDAPANSEPSAASPTADHMADWEDTDQWGSLEDPPESTSNTHREKSSTEGWGEWGDSDFTTTLDNPGVSPASAYAWDGSNCSESDFFSSLSNPTGKASSASKKTCAIQTGASTKGPKSEPQKTENWQEESWGDPNDWGGDGAFSKTSDDAMRKKKEREERKMQRQKELQEKREQRKTAGAMKLGVKKLSRD